MTDGAEEYVLCVPRDESGRLELLARRPPFWEYLLFGNVLYVSRSAYDWTWRDFELGYTVRVGPVIEATQIADTIKERMTHASAIVSNISHILAPAAQDRAFGRPGEPGDSALIQHMASRLIDLYALLLEWAEETRALRVPDWAERLKEIAVTLVRQPIERTHDFVDEFIANLEKVIAKSAEGDTAPVTITMELIYEIDDSVIAEFDRELRRVNEYLH
jgi:hypothetical protein